MNTIATSFFRRDIQLPALAELVGTFFLTLAALLAGTPVAVGLTLAVFVYAFGNLSGAHLNPAVTIGLVTTRHFRLGPGLVYIVAQIVGALLARLVAGLVGDLQPDYQAAGIFGEFFGFGFLMLAVAAVTTESHVPAAGSGIAIGGALLAGLLTSGGILNPAVAIAMGEVLSAATWATLLSAIAFTAFFDSSPPRACPGVNAVPIRLPRLICASWYHKIMAQFQEYV